ncbi:MAG TPA: hypothetical protein VKK31_12200 [Thermoanaerobaculia bacterium]|nr:hypothetical protein [Thermoanaerobaculia bacterium]
MDEATRQSTLMSALTTEHFVLQTAASSTISESSARSSLYMLSLSSSLVAMGFMVQSREVFIPFVAAVLPAVFLLGVFTTIRLVDTSLEYMQYLAGIARIRSYYRSLGPEAAAYFAADHGRWPEAKSVPALQLGPLLAFFGTTASMIAVINNVLAGAGAALLAHVLLGEDHRWVALLTGIAAAGLLTLVFLAYQRWRFSTLEGANAQLDEPQHGA